MYVHENRHARPIAAGGRLDITSGKPRSDGMTQATSSRQSGKRSGSIKNLCDGFPFTAHPSGRWVKRHQGKQYYFGTLENWQAALDSYHREWPCIIAGRVPPPIESAGLRVKDLANRFLTAKRSLLTNGELSERSFGDYLRTCELVVNGFSGDRLVTDLRADDFATLRNSLAESRNPTTLSNEINRIRGVFKFAYDAGLIDSPIRFGPGFARPSKKTICLRRQAKQQEHGKRTSAAADLRMILHALVGTPVTVEGKDKPAKLPPKPALRGMMLMAANCGLGQSDLSNLPQSAIDLKAGWLDYRRPETGVERRVPLWPETLEALQEAISVRPEPKDPADGNLCLVTARGARWVKMTPTGTPDDAISKEFAKVLNRLKLKRYGLNLYGIRHGCQTVAGEARDPEATSHIMGNVDGSMAGLYREGNLSSITTIPPLDCSLTIWPSRSRMPRTTQG